MLFSINFVFLFKEKSCCSRDIKTQQQSFYDQKFRVDFTQPLLTHLKLRLVIVLKTEGCVQTQSRRAVNI